ncbi:MAG: hypothetical protein KDD44_05785, partial [Bdellovibrionales bacterium]|nr:hypothetical protein [Bdellovibrionales bacterium]
MRMYGENNPRDFEIQLQVASTIFVSGYTVKNAGVPGEPLLEEGEQRAQKLVEEFSTEPRAFGHLGHVKFMLQKIAESRKAFDQCLRLDNINEYCTKYRAFIDEHFDEAGEPIPGAFGAGSSAAGEPSGASSSETPGESASQ